MVKIEKITRVPKKLKAVYKSDFTSFTSRSVSLSPTIAKDMTADHDKRIVCPSPETPPEFNH